jgi:hypothetical protein
MASPGAGGEGLGVSPLQPRQAGDGTTWHPGGDTVGLRRTRSRGRATEWLQSLARRRPRSAPGGALLVRLTCGDVHGGAELRAQCGTNERSDDRNEVTRGARLAFLLTQTRRGRLHACVGCQPRHLARVACRSSVGGRGVQDRGGRSVHRRAPGPQRRRPGVRTPDRPTHATWTACGLRTRAPATRRARRLGVQTRFWFPVPVFENA